MGEKAIGGLTACAQREHMAAAAGFVGCLALLALTAIPAAAQVQDTLRADTLAADTLLAEQDTLLPPPVMVEWPRDDREPGGLVDGRWVWDQEALLSRGDVSVLDLLNDIPGLVTFRSGVFLQPESISAFAGGADRLVITRDGFVLDPLASASYDLSGIRLSDLARIEVERRADATVIRLESAAPTDARAYSRIEAGVGEPEANLFRGILLAPHFLFGPFGVAVERLDLRGSGRPQPADVFDGWVRWGLLSERRGLELIFNSSTLGREPESPMPLDGSRQDLLLRGRMAITAGGVAEAYVGRSDLTIDETDPAIPDSLRTSRDAGSTQAGARVAWQADGGTIEGAVRWRDEPRLPQLDFELNGRASPLTGLQLAAGLTSQKWDSGFGATSYHGSASWGPFDWIRVFAEFADGRRGSPSTVDSITTPHKSTRQLIRGGVEANRWGITATVAGVRTTADSVPLLGLPGDSLTTGAVEAGTLTGWEASARVPLLVDWLSFEGAWSTWLSGIRSAYTPASIGRASLRLHAVPLESGNLEFVGRLDAMHRGVLTGPPEAVGEPVTEAPARTLFNAYFQIRIVSVRIWVRFDDMAGNDVEDVPGLFIQGPRVFYGVKWSFWN